MREILLNLMKTVRLAESSTMLHEPSPMIVEETLCPCCEARTKRVHHRDFPEISAECRSVREGLAYLIKRLTSARENVQSQWRVELVDRAIADANEMMRSIADPQHVQAPSCCCDTTRVKVSEPAVLGNQFSN